MFALPLFLALVLTACENPVKKAAREIAYSGYEMIGIQKRDLLKRQIAATKTDQREAGGQVGDALQKIREIYHLPETDLSRRYRDLRGSFDQSDRRAKAARASRERMRTTARDLFKEWEGEIGQIHAADLARSSRRQLGEAKRKFETLDGSLGRAEKKMDAVLARLSDHLLSLKHNLNAESLAAMHAERDAIERDMTNLIDDMNRALAHADQIAL